MLYCHATPKKTTDNFHQICFFCLLLLFVYIPLTGITNFTALWITLASAASVALNFTNDFYAIVISYIVFMSVVVCFNIITAHAVTLYPIHCRAMATSFILTCGRLGSTLGSNFIGILLDVECNSIFYTFAATLTSKQEPKIKKFFLSIMVTLLKVSICCRHWQCVRSPIEWLDMDASERSNNASKKKLLTHVW